MPGSSAVPAPSGADESAIPGASESPGVSPEPGAGGPASSSAPAASTTPTGGAGGGPANPEAGIRIGGGATGADGPRIAGLDASAVGVLASLPSGLLAWSYPALVLSVPGLLLLLAVGSQAIGALAWLPLIRKKLGGFGPGESAPR